MTAASKHLTPRSKPFCDPNIGAPFDFDRVDMAAGGETLLQLAWPTPQSGQTLDDLAVA